MTPEQLSTHVPRISVESPSRLSSGDIHELCDAAEGAIMAGGGFGWLTPPPRSVMEDYWRGVQMIPERHLVVAKLDKVIAGESLDEVVDALVAEDQAQRLAEGAE